jgi:hypothetical protein
MQPTHYLKNPMYPNIIEIYCRDKDNIYHLQNCKNWLQVNNVSSFITGAVLERLKKSLRRLDNLRGNYFFSHKSFDELDVLAHIPKVFQTGCTLNLMNPVITKETLLKMLCGNYAKMDLDNDVCITFNPEGLNKGLQKNVVASIFSPEIYGPAVMMKISQYEKLRT